MAVPLAEFRKFEGVNILQKTPGLHERYPLYPAPPAANRSTVILVLLHSNIKIVLFLFRAVKKYSAPREKHLPLPRCCPTVSGRNQKNSSSSADAAGIRSFVGCAGKMVCSTLGSGSTGAASSR